MCISPHPAKVGQKRGGYDYALHESASSNVLVGFRVMQMTVVCVDCVLVHPPF